MVFAFVGRRSGTGSAGEGDQQSREQTVARELDIESRPCFVRSHRIHRASPYPYKGNVRVLG